MHVFVSYNESDKEHAVALAAQLRLLGCDVWLDEWEIRAGDSIPGRVNDALGVVKAVIVLWSEDAAASQWVGAELETALHRRLDGSDSLRVIPVRIDDAELPALLRPLKWLEFADPAEAGEIAKAILGIDTDAEYIKAVQQTISEAQIEVDYYPGYGPIVGCPRCGASLASIEGWSGVDDRRDDMYAGARCKDCGWNDGGEL